MARRLYLGRLPPDTRSDDVTKFFEGYGRIIDCRVMTGFGFLEFETAKDAEDALNQFSGKPFLGQNIVMEFAKESRPRRDVYESDRPRSRRPPGVRLIVSGISRDTSWQDLKDFGREAGNVSYADVDRDHPGQGVLEYLTRDDAERAIKDLDNRDLRGRPVRVALDESRGGADNYRRDDRRDDRPPRDDRYRDDRSYSRRDRSRSPPRYEDRRPRSPPPRRDYEEKRPAGYDDRRGGYYDRTNSNSYDDRRDAERRPARDDYDRRRDDDRRKDDRYEDRPARPSNEDRPARPSNGEGGWSR